MSHLRSVPDPRAGYIVDGDGSRMQAIHCSILDRSGEVRLIAVDEDGDGALIDLSPKDARGLANWLMSAAEIAEAAS